MQKGHSGKSSKTVFRKIQKCSACAKNAEMYSLLFLFLKYESEPPSARQTIKQSKGGKLKAKLRKGQHLMHQE